MPEDSPDPQSEPGPHNLFLGLGFSPRFQQAVRRVAQQLEPRFPGGRWHPPSNLHLTLRFFGRLSSRERAEVLERASRRAAEARPLILRLERVGFFGAPRRPRVLWLAPEGASEELVALSEALREAFPEVQERPFAPHVTLARFRSRLSQAQREACFPTLLELKRGRERGELPAWARFEAIEERAARLLLFESRPGEGGVQYVPVESLPLGPAASS